MNFKQITAAICAVSITAVSFSGCSNAANSDNESSLVEDLTVTVQVNNIENNTITGETGTIKQSNISIPPEENNAQYNNSGKETPSNTDKLDTEDKPPIENSLPESDIPENSNLDETAHNNQPSENVAPPQAEKNTFESDGGEITFTLTDDTKITVEFLQGESEGSIDDIYVGSILEATLDEDNTASEITVKNLNSNGSFGGSGEVTNGTSANTINENTSISEKTYASSGDNENALRIDGAIASLENITVEKIDGQSSNTEDGDFYGQNAALLVLGGSQTTIKNSTITSNAINGNGVFSYGEGTVVNISDSTIRTLNRNSGGIQTTGGGTTNASNLDIETQGDSSAAIRSDRGGGTVNVDSGTYVTNGKGSPAIYSTAEIAVSNADLMANNSEAIVVEGKNSVDLNNCNIAGNMTESASGDKNDNLHCIMIYQSMSGDADIGEASFSANGGSITSLSGDLFYITNTDCQINLKNVTFTTANDIFMTIEGNSSSRGWGTEGANGGNVVLNTENQVIEGKFIVDSISSLDFTLGNGTNFTGAINFENNGGIVNVVMEEGASWTLTADTYITSFSGDASKIITNGHHLYVDGTAVL